MAKKQFKTESKRILDLMINSVYTHHEIFLRELISNASDAIDKLYFRSLTDGTVCLSRDEYQIELNADKEARTLTIRDNGCGMTEEELSENLGVIAHSGTLGFREEKGKQEDIETIGQFGVGFYASFMVAGRVEVRSRAFGGDTAYLWASEGTDGYTVTPCEKEGHGTEITLYIKPDTEDEQYDEFLEPYRLRGLVTKYSDYIRYPIVMDWEAQQPKEGNADEYETVIERKTLNSMIPIWRRNKAELTKEEYNGFYKSKFMDYEDPVLTIHYNVEGNVTYTALLYIPSGAPFNYYTKEYEKGLQLYAAGVLITDKCSELLPDHYSFVRGLCDSQDLSLNISREMLQHNRQLSGMAKNIEKKIRSELLKLLENERERYEKFYKTFGLQLKYGLYANYGMNKEDLQDLVLFHSMAEDKPISFKEYREKMPEEQKYIYYVCADTAAKAALLPQTERVREKGFDILCLTEDVDEFALKTLNKYDEKEFRSVSADGLDLDENEKAAQKKHSEENAGLLQKMKEILDGQVSDVVVSARLSKHPVCLSSEGALSIEMEKVLSAMPGADGGAKAKRVLELNAAHPVFASLQALLETDEGKLALYTNLLYSQALLIEGLTPDDPVAFARDICSLMTE